MYIQVFFQFLIRTGTVYPVNKMTKYYNQCQLWSALVSSVPGALTRYSKQTFTLKLRIGRYDYVLPKLYLHGGVFDQIYVLKVVFSARTV